MLHGKDKHYMGIHWQTQVSHHHHHRLAPRRRGGRRKLAQIRHSEYANQYQEQFERDSTRLDALINTPKGVERVARERYLMKRENEDIFIMSTDQKTE